VGGGLRWRAYQRAEIYSSRQGSFQRPCGGTAQDRRACSRVAGDDTFWNKQSVSKTCGGSMNLIHIYTCKYIKIV
jgi:hypothetical protein